jgi:hypothetical protein
MKKNVIIMLVGILAIIVFAVWLQAANQQLIKHEQANVGQAWESNVALLEGNWKPYASTNHDTLFIGPGLGKMDSLDTTLAYEHYKNMGLIFTADGGDSISVKLYGGKWTDDTTWTVLELYTLNVAGDGDTVVYWGITDSLTINENNIEDFFLIFARTGDDDDTVKVYDGRLIRNNY